MMSNPTPYGSAARATTPTPRRRAVQPPTPDSYEEILELGFVCRRKSRSILNSTVVGRDGYTPYFHIMTGPESTLFRTNDGRTVATIEWRGKGGEAFVEVRGAVSKQRVSQWLGVAEDARRVHACVHPWSKFKRLLLSYRMMIAHRERYVWVPQNHSICVSFEVYPMFLKLIDFHLGRCIIGTQRQPEMFPSSSLELRRRAERSR
jgi:hypothetical protein